MLVEGCNLKYGAPATFKNVSHARPADSPEDIPPLLLSMPGSGNTFLRILLEHATGHLTGSIYLGDKELQWVFKGETSCARSNSVIKSHPADLIISGALNSWNTPAIKGDTRKKLRGRDRKMRVKCGRGNIQYFPRAVILVRDPLKSILSDFQRVATQSHVGSVSLDKTQRSNIKAVRRPLKSLNLTAFWLLNAMDQARAYRQSMREILQPLLSSPHPDHPDLDVAIHLVRFEDLIAKETRYATLSSLLQFVVPDAEVNQERMRCAYYAIDTAEMRREKSLLDFKEMYNTIYPPLVCDVWNHTREFALAFGYVATPNAAYKTLQQQCDLNLISNPKPNLHRHNRPAAARL